MDLLETDFTHVKDISQNPDWIRQQFNVTAEIGRGEYGKSFMPENVESRPVNQINTKAVPPEVPGLDLIVGTGKGNNAVPAGEIDTKRLDLHWGSYRAGMKLTNVNGTCAAFFWVGSCRHYVLFMVNSANIDQYFNDTQEIDIEFLSREFDFVNKVYPVNLVVQSRRSMESGYDAINTGTFTRANLTFDPTIGFHEYRFDYLPGQVLFYADSELLARMKGNEMPSTGGHLILQHWSNGNPQWSGGPPVQDAALTVSYVKAYFNSSDGQRQADATSRCHDSSAEGAVCVIPDVTAANASTGGRFFTPTTPAPKNKDDEEDGVGHLEASLWGIMVLIMGVTIY